MVVQKLNVTSDIKQAVFLAAAMTDDEEQYSALHTLYTSSSTSANDKALLLYALMAGPAQLSFCKRSLMLLDVRAPPPKPTYFIHKQHYNDCWHKGLTCCIFLSHTHLF